MLKLNSATLSIALIKNAAQKAVNKNTM